MTAEQSAMPTGESRAVTRGDIEDGLQRIGLAAGDTVLVHSSLRSFGRIDGGADTVVAALQAVLGPRGALVMPTLTLGAREDQIVFDVRRSPSTSGTLTEVFRQRDDVCRSHHPFSSAAAWGWGARELCAHHDGLPCSLTSPYGQVYLRAGYSLFMGAGLACNTVFHVAEELEGPSYLRYAVFPDVMVVDEQGIQRRVTARRYNCYQTGIRRHLERMESIFDQAGVLSETYVGLSRWRLLWAPDNVRLSRDVLRERPSFILEPGDDH